jgi:hypothetical protein
VYKHCEALSPVPIKDHIEPMSDESPVDECPICFEPLDQPNKAYFKASCNHAFHVACLNASVAAGNKSCCPYCRCNWETDRVVVRSTAHTAPISTTDIESLVHDLERDRRDEIQHFEHTFLKTMSILKYPISLVNAIFLSLFARFVFLMPRDKVLFVVVSSLIFVMVCVGQTRRLTRGAFVRDVVSARITRYFQDHLSIYSCVCVQCVILSYQLVEPNHFLRAVLYFYLTFFHCIILKTMRQSVRIPPANEAYFFFCMLSVIPFLRALYLADVVYALITLVFVLTPAIELRLTLKFDYATVVPMRFAGYVAFELLSCATNALHLYKNVAPMSDSLFTNLFVPL